MRPLLEYGSEVWDGCSINDANRLEQIQLNSARIVTGLQILASLRSLYYETGWGKSGGQNANKKVNFNVQNCKWRCSIIYSRFIAK